MGIGSNDDIWRVEAWVANLTDETFSQVIFNLAEGGIMPGPPTPETSFPASFLVDYVRVW